jgi:hypothetical protein
MCIDDEEHRCPAGSFICIPAEAPHGFRVGGVRSRKLNPYLRASMVGYFDELSDAIRSGEADRAVLDGIAVWQAAVAGRFPWTDPRAVYG